MPEISSRQPPDEFHIALQEIEPFKVLQTDPADLFVNVIVELATEIWNGQKEQAHATAARILVFIISKLGVDRRNDLQLFA